MKNNAPEFGKPLKEKMQQMDKDLQELKGIMNNRIRYEEDELDGLKDITSDRAFFLGKLEALLNDYGHLYRESYPLVKVEYALIIIMN